jgi:hypothetical protein
MSRATRDILAECLRRERLGLSRPFWHDLATFDQEACEHVRKRADHLMALLESYGVRLVQEGKPRPEPRPAEIWRYWLVGRKAERVVRRGAGENWQIVLVEGGAETVEMNFTAAQASINGGLVLTDDPAAKVIPGLGRQLAALCEILRLCAAAAPEKTEAA